MGMAEVSRAVLKCDNVTESELARRIGITPQNLSNKMKRDNFTERDLQEIADALGVKLEIAFIDSQKGITFSKRT